ncbi:MAG: PHB depolymerase family esterase [Pseudomonadota bacterium]
MRLHAILKLLFAAACGAIAIQGAHAATITPLDIARPEGKRHYLLGTPDNIAPGKRPLVILLHGHGGWADQVLGQKDIVSPLSVWLRIADREQVLVAAPDGAKGDDGKQGWNDCRSDAFTNPRTDDVGLINAIIDRAIAEHDADPARIYAMGMSNGGIMAFRLALEIAPRLAGIATIGAAMAAKSACPPARQPVSALIVSGTKDPIVPYGGGDIHFALLRSRGTVIGVEESAALWRQLAQLPAAPAQTEFEHRAASGATRALRLLWGGDPSRLQVELLKIEEGGHLEPSISKRLGWAYTVLLGAQNADVEVAEEAWRFFKDKRAGLLP